ncbi:MAG TPA: hypothetical protein VKP30_22180 [Polyangiaceae bacterium]|nr:hypothetical protein [Polyangiaceae bacterium]
MTRVISFLPLFVLGASFIGGSALGAPVESQRYPFDPACAWGRLSDGKGLFVRCLTREEAERLSKPPTPATAAPTNRGTSESAAPVSSATAPVSPPGAPTPPNAAGATAAPAPGAEALNADAFTAELVSVAADEGELPLAKRKLAVPLDRYAKCVAEHGGLKSSVGQVEVRFLVRERGRAEGAGPEKYQGMSEAAANCIAQVVDRRQTGSPAGPVVGATAIIRVRKRAGK